MENSVDNHLRQNKKEILKEYLLESYYTIRFNSRMIVSCSNECTASDSIIRSSPIKLNFSLPHICKTVLYLA
jgi:hypothetical protein